MLWFWLLILFVSLFFLVMDIIRYYRHKALNEMYRYHRDGKDEGYQEGFNDAWALSQYMDRETYLNMVARKEAE